MRILYYDWDEFNGSDCRDAMKRLGHDVDSIKIDKMGYDLTSEIEKAFFEKIFDATFSSVNEQISDNTNRNSSPKYDIIFSFDYFPNISEFCQKYNIPYISWVFDCPHYTTDSHTITNSVNKVFFFDKKLFQNKLAQGVSTVRYCPLGVNAERLSELCQKLDSETNGQIIYEHDVCFLGNLYDNEYNFYDQVNYLPPYLKGYVDAIITAQERVFGADFFTESAIFSDKHVQELREYIKFEQTGKYEIDYDNVIRDILRKKVTVNERHHILEEMGKRFDTVLYTTPGAKGIDGVANLGTANYFAKMPRVFRRSKVNLNITLRSILSGIPLRVLDILAAGGFLITNYQEEIAEFFVDGQDLVIAYTPEDMIQKTAYYLEHEDERKEIALNGQRKVLECFAYTKLLPEILS